MTVAQVNVCQKKIVKILASESEPVAFDHYHDLTHERLKLLSHKSMDQGLVTLGRFAKQIAALGIKDENINGIATGIFRKVDNSKAYLEKVRQETNISFKVLSSLEEISSAIEITKLTHQKQDFMVWDIGGESMQLGLVSPDGRSDYLVGFDGSQKLRKKLLSKFKSLQDGIVHESDYPRLRKMVDENYTGIKLDSIKNKIPKTVIGLGGVHNRAILETLVNLNMIPKEQKEFSLGEVKNLLHVYLNQSKAEIQGAYAENQTLNLILVSTLMEKLNIQKVIVSSNKPADILLVEGQINP